MTAVQCGGDDQREHDADRFGGEQCGGSWRRRSERLWRSERSRRQRNPAAVRRGGRGDRRICHRGFGGTGGSGGSGGGAGGTAGSGGAKADAAAGSGGMADSVDPIRREPTRRLAKQARVPRPSRWTAILAATKRCSARYGGRACACLSGGGGAGRAVAVRQHSRRGGADGGSCPQTQPAPRSSVRWRRSGHLLFVTQATCFASATCKRNGSAQSLDALRRRHSPHRRRSRNAARGSTSRSCAQYGQNVHAEQRLLLHYPCTGGRCVIIVN